MLRSLISVDEWKFGLLKFNINLHLTNLFQEEPVSNLAKHESINDHFGRTHKGLVSSKVESDSTKHISQNYNCKGISRATGGSRRKFHHSLNRCEHSLDTNKLLNKKRMDFLHFI